MDALEQGASYIVTRDGHVIGELVPRRTATPFVPRERFIELAAGLESIDAKAFRDDIDSYLDPDLGDPYGR